MKSQKVYFNKEIDRIIRTEPNRKRIDVEKLYKQFHRFSYFDNIICTNQHGQLMVETIFEQIYFQEYKEEERIFTKDDLIQDVFIVFQGEVNLYKPPFKRLKPLPKTASGLEKFKQNFRNYLYASVDKKLDKTFKEGEMIKGNIIFIDKKRASLCEAKTNCLIGRLTQTSYIKIFHNTEGLEKNNIKTFISSLPFFAKIKTSLDTNIQSKLKKKEFSKGEILFKQGEKFNNIYIIRRGTFQVSFKSSIRFFTYFDMNCFFELYKDLNERFSSIQNHELNNSYKEIKNYKLLNLCNGEFLGHIEYKLHSKAYLFTVECITDKSEIFEISKTDFEKELTPHCKQILFEEAMKKMIILQGRLKEIRTINRPKEQERNKYRSVILRKMTKKDELITQKTTEENKPLKIMDPISGIQKVSIDTQTKELLNAFRQSKNNSLPTQIESSQSYYSMNYFYNYSIATCETLCHTTSNNPKDNKGNPSKTLLVKKNKTDKNLYRPQTAKISKYKQLHQIVKNLTTNTVTRDSTLEKNKQLGNNKQIPNIDQYNNQSFKNNNKTTISQRMPDISNFYLANSKYNSN